MGKIRRQPHKPHHFSSLAGLQPVYVVNDDDDSRLCLFQCFPETVTFLMQARLFRPLVRGSTKQLRNQGCAGYRA